MKSQRRDNMNLLAIILFVFTSSIDNFTVALAYGVKNIKISFFSNLVISIVSSLGTFISMSLGLALANLLAPQTANIIGSTILLLIGLWFLYDYYRSIKNIQSINQSDSSNNRSCMNLLDNPEVADFDHSGTIDLKESFSLSVALAINNVGLGIGGSIAGLDIIRTTLFTFIFSIIVIPIGMFLGNKFLAKKLGSAAPLISALILISLGLFELALN
ncbi:sporulation membrane protein YtaF [Clostridium zeae]|nr:sporulation membrane protein YtaF [Clostridium zeae]